MFDAELAAGRLPEAQRVGSRRQVSAARQELAVRGERHVKISYDGPDLHDRAGLARPNVEQGDAAIGKAGEDGQQFSVGREDGRDVDHPGVGQRLLPFSLARGGVPQADHALRGRSARRVHSHADDGQPLSVGGEGDPAGIGVVPDSHRKVRRGGLFGPRDGSGENHNDRRGDGESGIIGKDIRHCGRHCYFLFLFCSRFRPHPAGYPLGADGE